MTTDNQGFPQSSAPITDPRTGRATATFYQLMIALWNRTGGPSNIVGQSVFPGEVRAFAGPLTTDPKGYLILTPSAREVSRTTYANLYAAIGSTWGDGNGSTTFNLPPSDRVLIGASVNYPAGSLGGSKTETLSVGNLPPHNHVVDDPEHTHAFTGTAHGHGVTDAGHTHTDGTPNPTADVAAGAAKTSAIAGNTGNSTTGIAIQTTIAGGTNAASATGVTTENTGSGDAISILPPYAAMTFLIKT